jgi:ATP-binding cassette, subfamily B, bacterial
MSGVRPSRVGGDTASGSQDGRPAATEHRRSEAGRQASGSSAARGPTPTVDEILYQTGERDLRRLPALLRQAFALVWRAAPRQLLVAGGLQVLAGLSLVAQLFVLRRVIERVMAADGIPSLGALLPDLLALGGLLMLVAVAGLAQREQQQTLSELVQKHTTGRVMDVSTRVDLIDFDRPAFYDRLQRARVNASVRPLQIANGVIGLLSSGVAVVAVGAALIWLEPIVAALILVGGVPTLYLNRKSSKVMHAYAVRQTPGDRRRAYLYEILSRKDEAQEVRAFDSSSHLRDEHDRLYDDKIADLRRTVRRRMLYGTASGLITAVVTVGSLALLLAFVGSGRLAVGDAAVAVGAVVIVAGRVRGLLASSGSLYEGSLFLRDFTDFVEADRRQRARPEVAVVPRGFADIHLEGVGFTYPSRVEPSIRDVSLTIRHGEVIALVGENGSGKTTLTKILAGLYRPTAGRVRWNGVDLDELDLADVRENVAVIFQDFARYFLSAHENVGISRIAELGDRSAVRRAATLSGADGFLSALPAGYDTLLGPAFVGGSDLSVGQWQRVALARAYFRDTPMLILDEPTAALDPRGEYDIFQQVRRMAEGHTVVLVSHRFSNVRAADRILVLDQGLIVEDGSHEELVARGGLYAELFNLQADGYRQTPR